jgi:hypothetical protein
MLGESGLTVLEEDFLPAVEGLVRNDTLVTAIRNGRLFKEMAA